jgi:hypothetical protein
VEYSNPKALCCVPPLELLMSIPLTINAPQILWPEERNPLGEGPLTLCNLSSSPDDSSREKISKWRVSYLD